MLLLHLAWRETLDRRSGSWTALMSKAEAERQHGPRGGVQAEGQDGAGEPREIPVVPVV